MSAKKNHCRVCFISLSSYPLLAGKDMGFVGGAEVLLVQLAKGIAGQGFEVSFVTYDDGGDRVELIDGIKVIKAYKQQDALSLSPLKKVWHIWQALRMADADVYLEHPGLGGVVSLFCRLYGKKAILYIGSEAEVVKRRIVTNGKLYFSLGHGFDIKAAHVVVAQSEYQKKMLRENYHRDSIIVKIPIPLSEPAMPARNGIPTVLWLATVKPLKQAELFLDLARAMPQAKFQMVGGPALGDESYYHSIKEAAAAIPNLEFSGFVPHEKIGSYIAKSNILVNTSIVEGFPVTFLEAWAACIPVVSLNADPDEVICRLGLGRHSRTYGQMVQDIKELLGNVDLRDEMGNNGRKYVEDGHDIQKIMAEFKALFLKLTGIRQPQSGDLCEYP